MTDEPESRVVAVHEAMSLPMSAKEVSAQVQAIQQIMAGVMKEGTHYGTIQGTTKPTLYKAGAEALLSAFRIAVKPVVEDLSANDEVRYRVICEGIHVLTGRTVGYGAGECSSQEEKYAWEYATEAQYEQTLATRRRIKFGWDWHPTIRGKKVDSEKKQVRTNAFDKANTILKMAKKRAQIDLCLTALAASDCFAQDLEDPHTLAEPEQAAANHPKAGTSAPTRKPAEPEPPATAPGKITDGQRRVILAKIDDAGVDSRQLCEQFSIASLPELDADQINSALEWIKEKAAT
jgi:hypothetical protein